jgi:demethylmenaquinone methyltransferase/2-methoxy-6-polyprenyl-1,4-benzoquinol methylase
MDDKKAFFGYKEVSASQKTSLVNKVFSSVSSKYDVMNDLMSGGLHRLWKEEFIKHISDFHGKFLDMASGTGDIAIKIYKKSNKLYGKEADITACDASSEMLEIGRAKALDAGITSIKYEICFAEKLPFEDNSFDYYIVAFGIRNFTDIKEALKEALRVLKPGGKFLCLEFSKVQNPVLSSIYNFYSMNMIPFIGKAVAKDEEAYRYLVESIRKFPDQIKFKNMIEEAGFTNIKYSSMTFGTVAIHVGYKPHSRTREKS